MIQISSLYLHIPFCKHLCNYCDFYKKRFDSSSQIEEFHQFLISSLRRHEVLLKENGAILAPMETIYLGGGTPSLWGVEGARFFKDVLLKTLKIKNDAEFTMEIDPGTWAPELITHWQEVGLNRISIGTQTLNPEFLKIMDRAHTLDESFELLKYCSTNRWNFSLDFLLGLPFSIAKKRQVLDELKSLLDYSPKHISLYILNARSKYPHIQEIPDDEFIREEYLMVSEFLRSQGFHHYEVSNFALPGFESKHNLKYWNSESVAALGPSGTGLIACDENSACRYKWKVTQAEVEIENLGPDEIELERIYLELRTSRGWKPMQMGPALLEQFQRWNSLNYGVWNGERMILNSHGFLILDSLMDDIFRL